MSARNESDIPDFANRGIALEYWRRLNYILTPALVTLGTACYAVVRRVDISAGLTFAAVFSGGLLLQTAILRRGWLATDRLETKRLKTLAAKQLRNELAVEAATAGTWEVDLATDQIIRSRELFKIYGIESDGELPRPFEQLPAVHPDDVEISRQAAADIRAMRPGDRLTREFRIHHPERGTRWLQLTAFHQTDGQSRTVVGLTIDITDRRAIEEAARSAQARAEALQSVAERAVATRSRFVASAGHDLRQPLQSMVLYVDLLRQTAVQAQTQYIDNLGASVGAMTELVERLLEISRLDAGLVPVKPEMLNVSDLIERLHLEFENKATLANMTFRHYKSDAWAMADRVVVDRILRELLSNAFKFAVGRRAAIGCIRLRDTVCICVIDRGIGIPVDRVDEIFDDFNQLANPDLDRTKGFGLGLSVARRLADIGGHRLGILTTKLGRGTAVMVELPRVDGPRTTTVVRVPTPAGQFGGLTIALIEDDHFVRMAVADILRRWQFDVIEGAGVDDILDTVRENPTLDLIIADYRLRDNATGVEAAKIISSLATIQPPSIILTGDPDPGIDKVVEAHGMTLLRKPVQPEILRQAINEALFGGAPWLRS